MSLVPPVVATVLYFVLGVAERLIGAGLSIPIVIAYGLAAGLLVLLVFWANDWWRLLRDIRRGSFMRRSGMSDVVEQPAYPGPWNLHPDEVLYVGERRYPIVLLPGVLGAGRRWLGVDHTRSGFVFEVRDRAGKVLYRAAEYRPDEATGP